MVGIQACKFDPLQAVIGVEKGPGKMKVSYSQSTRYIELGWVTLQRRWWVKSQCRFTQHVAETEKPLAKDKCPSDH